MTADEIKQRIVSMVSHFIFEYEGKNCGVDPITPTHFDVWFDTDFTSMDSVDSVMTTPFFN